MSELTWLAEIIANHDLTPKLKKHIIKRMKFIDNSTPQHQKPVSQQTINHQAIQTQAPSTLALMEKHGLLDLAPISAPSQPQTINSNAPIAVTPQAAMALQSRQTAIELALSGKSEKGRTSPRKF